MTLEAIRYKQRQLSILDQLLLPAETQYVDIKSVEDGWNAIHSMQVRGAPAIAIVGCLSLAVQLHNYEASSKTELYTFVQKKLQYLETARPTAVNMKKASKKLITLTDAWRNDQCVGLYEMRGNIIKEIEQMLKDDIEDNKSIGMHGANSIYEDVSQEPVTILTHCNTGSLATSGYGTALGVVRYLHGDGRLKHVYCTETRPYNQGARLTAYEIVAEGMPGTLICDNMVAALMNSRRIDAVVVGADRIACNGDTANKIGTYQIAVLAKHHNVPFYVAAPLTSIDFDLASGHEIIIEERPIVEMTHLKGERVAADGISCWNPAFDVTPANLITGGIITEKGVVKANELELLK